jgi:hypothetical protein
MLSALAHDPDTGLIYHGNANILQKDVSAILLVISWIFTLVTIQAKRMACDTLFLTVGSSIMKTSEIWIRQKLNLSPFAEGVNGCLTEFLICLHRYGKN